jgi:hypothetical protein
MAPAFPVTHTMQSWQHHPGHTDVYARIPVRVCASVCLCVHIPVSNVHEAKSGNNLSLGSLMHRDESASK